MRLICEICNWKSEQLNYTFLNSISGSSHRRCSVKEGVLRNFAKFTGKHLKCWDKRGNIRKLNHSGDIRQFNNKKHQMNTLWQENSQTCGTNYQDNINEIFSYRTDITHKKLNYRLP